MTVLMWLVMILLLSPTVYASPESGTFPNLPFNVFNNFINKNFNENISLSTVFLIFFTLIENSDLLNLHARQRIKVLPGEKNTQATGWMKCLSCQYFSLPHRVHLDKCPVHWTPLDSTGLDHIKSIKRLSLQSSGLHWTGPHKIHKKAKCPVQWTPLDSI